jgi:hypothetical protein
MIAGQLTQSKYDAVRADMRIAGQGRPSIDPIVTDGNTERYVYPKPDVVRERAARRKKAVRRKSLLTGAANIWSMAIGEDAALGRLLAGIVIAGIFGIVYLAACMNVAYQGRVLHTLQLQKTAETARQHQLINDIGVMESPGKIADEATKMGMVMTGKADYISVRDAQNARQILPSTVAIAEADPVDDVDTTP